MVGIAGHSPRKHSRSQALAPARSRRFRGWRGKSGAGDGRASACELQKTPASQNSHICRPWRCSGTGTGRSSKSAAGRPANKPWRTWSPQACRSKHRHMGSAFLTSLVVQATRSASDARETLHQIFPEPHRLQVQSLQQALQARGRPGISEYPLSEV